MSTQEKQMDKKPELGPTPQRLESWQIAFEKKHGSPPSVSDITWFKAMHPQWGRAFPRKAN